VKDARAPTCAPSLQYLLLGTGDAPDVRLRARRDDGGRLAGSIRNTTIGYREGMPTAPSPLLLVHFDDAARVAVARRLQDAGYAVAAAASLEEAIRLLDDGLAPCMLLVIASGLEAVGDYRAAAERHEKLAGVPALLYTETSGLEGPEAAAHPVLDAVKRLLEQHCERTQ
jgi:hypothetical protein